MRDSQATNVFKTARVSSIANRRSILELTHWMVLHRPFELVAVTGKVKRGKTRSPVTRRVRGQQLFLGLIARYSAIPGHLRG